MEVLKKEKCCGNTNQQTSVSTAFSSSPQLYLLLTKHEIKMAGYRPSSGFKLNRSISISCIQLFFTALFLFCIFWHYSNSEQNTKHYIQKTINQACSGPYRENIDPWPTCLVDKIHVYSVSRLPKLFVSAHLYSRPRLFKGWIMLSTR